MVRKQISLIIISFFLFSPLAVSYVGTIGRVVYGIASHPGVFSDKEIERLAVLAKTPQGTRKVGKEIAGHPTEVIEDTYLRISVKNGSITLDTAEGMFLRLSGTPGFASNLKKIMAANPFHYGFLNELLIADNAAKKGFKVLSIEEKFNDGLRLSDTDIDIVLKKGKKVFAVEAKSRPASTNIAMDQVRADMDTLVKYREKNPDAVPVFTITNLPKDPEYLKALKEAADKRRVELIFGSPESQIEQINMLADL